MGANDPCYGCKKREVGCHSKCEDYITWAANIREMHKRAYKKKGEEMITNEYQIDKRRKLCKKIK